jgi:hypothetical protein
MSAYVTLKDGETTTVGALATPDSYAVEVSSGLPGPAGANGANGTNGSNGVSITSANIVSGNLVLTFSNSSTLNVGIVVGANGANGSNGTNGSNGVSVTTANIVSGNLVLTFSNTSTLDVGSVVGANGTNANTGNIIFSNTTMSAANSKLEFNSSGAPTIYLTTVTDDTTTLLMGTNVTELRAYTSVSIATDTSNTGYTWTFGENGDLTLPASGIITAPDDEFFKLQAKDTNSALRNEINLDPNNGTYMSVWSGELDTSFSADNWDTASWQNNGGQGYAIITNAEDLADFLTTGIGSYVNAIEVSINGGARTPVQYYGDNDEQYDVELLVTAIPGSTTEITSLTFYYRTQSKIDIDYDNGLIQLDGQGLGISLETTNDLNLRAGQNFNIRSAGQDSVRIYTDNSTHMWDFNNTGDLTLPREGKIYGLGLGPAGDRGGYISWSGNSSGDGFGYNTMRLVPDQQGLEDADQYIILDPTSPGHIHIRAGGTQDNSQAILYFGGENSHVKIDSGPNPPVTIAANNKIWAFGANGNLIFPDSTTQSTAYTGNVNGFAIGYRDVPQNFTNTSFTLALTDAGKHILTQNSGSSTQTITIPPNNTVAFQTGAAISIVVESTGTVALANGAGVTMYLAGNSTAKSSITLNSYSMATLLKIGTDTWFVSGTGAA